jgi:hypothetical protein
LSENIDYVNILGENVHTLRKNTEALLVASKDVLINLGTWSYLEIRMLEEVTRTIQRLIERMEGCKHFGKLSKSKLNLERNYEHLELRECLLIFGAASFVFFSLLSRNIKTKYREP